MRSRQSPGWPGLYPKQCHPLSPATVAWVPAQHPRSIH